MDDDIRKEFENWAVDNVGQFTSAGYHGTLGEWFYNRPYVQMCWRCWRAARG